jgi:hypothetical protein
LDVKDEMITAVPDLVVLEKACRGFFSHLHIEEISGFLVGEGDEVIVSEERQETNDQDDENERKGNPIEANPARLKGSDLAVAREGAESEEGAQEGCIGDCPLKSGFRDLIEKVFEHQVERCLKSIEKIHLLEEEDNDVNQDQTAQA